MPLIHRDELDSPTIRCQDDGAPISLIIDESEPGQGPRLHRHVYDETRVIQRGNISLQVGDQQLTPPQETWPSFHLGCHTSSSTTGGAAPGSFASTPAQQSSANGLNKATNLAKPTTAPTFALRSILGAPGRRPWVNRLRASLVVVIG